MKKIILILIVIINTNFVFSQCTLVTGLHTTNINYNNALANWMPIINIDHYKIQYKVYGTSSWSNLGNIGGLDSVRNLPLLQPNTTYEWEIKSFCDSTNQMASLWSTTDTFTTTSFVPSIFNPVITNSIDNNICNMHCNRWHYDKKYSKPSPRDAINLIITITIIIIVKRIPQVIIA